MQQRVDVKIGHSACPHDCPSTCALDIELLDNGRIGRVRGTKENDYTAGVICAKVARYAERLQDDDHPRRQGRGQDHQGEDEQQSDDTKGEAQAGARGARSLQSEACADSRPAQAISETTRTTDSR